MSRQRNLLLAIILMIALLAAACGSSDDGDSSSTTTAAEEAETSDTTEAVAPSTTAETPATTAAPETTSEAPVTAAVAGGAVADVQITTVDLTTGTVTLTNTTAAEVDLSGHWLCNRPVYVEVPAQTIAAGESVDVVLGDFDAAGGEAALYTSNSFGDAAAMVDYVHWGSGGGRAAVAAEAEVWTGDPIPADAVGDQLTQSGGGSADGWG